MLEKIRANAALAVRELAPLNNGAFGFDAASVRWLDEYLEGLRTRGQLEDRAICEKLVAVLGSYLGECIVRCHGGAWTEQQGHWCVRFGAGNCAFPFAKVAKRITNGREDSLGSFFDAIPALFARPPAGRPAQPRRAWWRFWRR